MNRAVVIVALIGLTLTSWTGPCLAARASTGWPHALVQYMQSVDTATPLIVCRGGPHCL